MSVVLMYHALFEDGNSLSIDEEDRPYALSRSEFARQLDTLTDRRVGLFNHSAKLQPHIVITFDDGHASNLRIAAPMLVERNLQAYFFITSDYLDQRPGFLSSDELAQLSAMPGMCIGSHGRSHRFFDDLSSSEARSELEQSRDAVAAITGSACCSLSFPGGRFNQQSIDLARAAGYRQWFGSRIGIVDNSAINHDCVSHDGDRWLLMQQTADEPIERVAIRIGTQLSEYLQIINKESTYFRRKILQSRVKSSIRRILGNRLYHGLYQSVSRR